MNEAPNYFVTGGARGIGSGIVLQAIREATSHMAQ